jgi:hypothetical protein
MVVRLRWCSDKHQPPRAQLSSVRASSIYGEDETRERDEGAPVMVGHYKLKACWNSSEATVKETAATLLPWLNRCYEMVDEVA